MKKLLFWGPVLTASGYGEHARQLLKGIVRSGLYDVSVCAVPWGQTPSIDSTSDEFADEINSLVKKFEGDQNSGNARYEIAIQVTIPNEFRRMAPLMIGVTAGIETDRVSPAWIKKANEQIDVLIVPSTHAAQTYANVSYRDPTNGSELKLNRPVLVVPEGFDGRVFNQNEVEVEDDLLSDLPEFNFISVGLGLDKPFGEDRKNFGNLIKWFCEEFKGDKRVGLVLKLSLVGSSLMDYNTIASRIKQIKDATGCGEFPKIKLIHGRLSKKSLAGLYKHPKVKAYITTTHGEGFGLPMIEASACGLPVLATDWSGHLDFLTNREGKKRFVPLAFDLGEIPQSAAWDGVIEKGSRWANPRESDVKEKMRKVFISYEKPLSWARELASTLPHTHEEVSLGVNFVRALNDITSQAGVSEQSDSDQISMMKKKYGIDDEKSLLYTMPMSTGDVFLSTKIIAVLKNKFPLHKIFFATQPKYASILKNNPFIHKVIDFENWMMDVSKCEAVFDEVYTPNLAIQLTTSNWIHRGKGRNLQNEMAVQCGIDPSDLNAYSHDIHFDDFSFSAAGEQYIVFHPGSGKGQWESRNYRGWKRVIKNFKKAFPAIEVVLVGLEDDIHIEGCVDLRGKTTPNQLASVIKRSLALVGIDSFPMHMAASFGIPVVALFGGSYSSSTGPANDYTGRNILLDAKNRCNGGKACYKNSCIVDRSNPCINEIDPKEVLKGIFVALQKGDVEIEWDDCRAKIAGYTHVLNAKTAGYPFVESITSMLGFCDEVIVVDGGSDDGTVEDIKAIGDDRIKIFVHEWDWNEPGMDGMQKAFGRAMVSSDIGPDDFLWQQDADEVVSEQDYEKIKALTDKFPTDVDVIHLPIIELWGSREKVRTDRHSWKWRLSRNNFRVTHGINSAARIVDDTTGRVYAKKGMSDGCEYIDILTNEFLPHRGFYDQRLETIRRTDPESYGREMNRIFNELPCVYHYSWVDLERKISNFKKFWNKCWSNLYNENNPTDRFPDVLSDADVVNKANELFTQGGEHGKSPTFTLERENPKIMDSWLKERSTNDRRHLHHDEVQTRAL